MQINNGTSLRLAWFYLLKSINKSLQQNVFLVTKISEEIFFVTKNTALVTKYEFRH